VGPTASGKSDIALAVADLLGARGQPVELVSMDSMQVYRGMDIGTAKPPPDLRRRVPHHLVDVADPSSSWDVTRHTAAVTGLVAAIESRGARALLVGGTGLYVQAVVDALSPPGRWPQLHQALDTEADTAALYQRLRRLDPKAAARIEPGNRRRILRALEVIVGSGRPFSSFGPGMDAYPPTSWRLAGVWLPREVVAARLEQRFAAMLSAGLVEEVAGLAARPGGLSSTARQALGYREILSHLEGGLPLEEATAIAVRRTREFARRQRVWWRRDPRVAWHGSPRNPLAVVPALVADWSRP
jgi:tRNA dimethylallyltransferase